MQRWLIGSALLVAQIAWFGIAQGAETVTIGNTSVVLRTVTGTLDGADRQISLNDDVYHNELVETAASSATEILFLDQTKLALGPNSSLVLDSLVFDPDPAKSSFITTTTKGVFRFVTGNLPKKSYTIHTPNATIGIRGTVFTLSVLPSLQPDGSVATVVELDLEEGAADITGCQDNPISLEQGGQRVTLMKDQSGNCGYVISDL